MRFGPASTRTPSNKDFWDWGYAFVSKGTALNRAHTTWLEHALIDLAHRLDSATSTTRPTPRSRASRSGSGLTRLASLARCYESAPLGVRVFEKPAASGDRLAALGHESPPAHGRGPARHGRRARTGGGFPGGLHRARTAGTRSASAGGMLPRIKYIAAYRTAPTSAITHYAPVERIEPYGDSGKYRLVFASRQRRSRRSLTATGSRALCRDRVTRVWRGCSRQRRSPTSLVPAWSRSPVPARCRRHRRAQPHLALECCSAGSTMRVRTSA